MKKLLKPFTLIELMIVVAIIAIIATIAVPQLMDARRNANEKSTVATLRSYMTDQTTYKSDNTTYGTIAQVKAAGKADLVSAVATPKAGYYYTDIIAAPTADAYAVKAKPSQFLSSGKKHFACSSTGKLRQDVPLAATPTVEPAVLDAITNVVGSEQATLDSIEALDEVKS